MPSAAQATKRRTGKRSMGTFHVDCIIEKHVDRRRTARISKLLVDTGSNYTWLPEQALKRIGVAPTDQRI